MKLILVRHAVTEETGVRLSGRIPGIALSKSGIASAWPIAGILARHDIAAFYTSPIQRCRETASILATPHGAKPQVRRALIEVEYGGWSGRTLKSLYRLRRWRDLMADPAGFRFPDGETLDEVRRRAASSVNRLAASHRDETVVAVSHGDVIRALVCEALTGSVDLIHRIHVAPLGMTVLEVSGQHPPRVIVMNAPRL